MKNMYNFQASRTWLLMMIWAMSLALTTKAQQIPPPQIQWQQVFDNDQQTGVISDVVKASNGGYAVMTYNQLVRFSDTGNILWTSTITGTPSTSTPGDFANFYNTAGLVATPDGGFVTIVEDSGYISLLKINSDGTLAWRKTIVSQYDNTRLFVVNNMIPTPDGGYFALGRVGPGFQKGALGIKLDQNGTIVWHKEIYYSTDVKAQAIKAINSADGGYVLVGYIRVSTSSLVGWAGKLDGQGNLIWQTRYDDLSFLEDVIQSPYNPDSYIAVGAGSADPSLTKVLIINQDGSIGSTFNENGRATNTASKLVAVPPTNGSPAYLTIFDTGSQNNGDLRLLTINNLNETLWYKTLGGSANEKAQAMIRTDDGGYVIAGLTTSTDGDVVGKAPNPVTSWVVRLSGATSTGSLSLLQPTYDCATGAITFNTTGGDSSPITYSAPGISRSSATSNTGTVEPGLRNDPKPITIQVIQSGQTVSYTFDFGAYCGNTPTTPTILPPVVDGPIPTLFLRVNSGKPTKPFVISQYFHDPTQPHANYQSNLRFSATNLPNGLFLKDLSAVDAPYALIAGPAYRDGTFTATLTATNLNLPGPNNSVSTPLTIQIIDKPETNPDNELRLTQPNYNCESGVIVFNTALRTWEPNDTPLTFSAPGVILPSATSNTGVIEESLRNNPTPITIQAMQNGRTSTYVFDLKAYISAYCSNPQPPIIASIVILAPTYDCATGAITFNTTGGNGSPITYIAPGVSRSSETSNTGTVEPGLRNDPKPIVITAIQSGVSSIYTFDFKAFCGANTGVDPPVTTTGLSLLAPTYDCQSGAFHFNTSGGDGTLIEFSAIGITGWTSNPDQFVDTESRTANDVKPFTLTARQNGAVTTYTWDLKAACGRARLGVAETGAGLQVRVLGNPVESQLAEVEISGVEGQSLHVDLVDLQRRLLHQQRIDQATTQERFRVPIGTGKGLLLLQVSTPTERQQIKLLKH